MGQTELIVLQWPLLVATSISVYIFLLSTMVALFLLRDQLARCSLDDECMGKGVKREDKGMAHALRFNYKVLGGL